MNVLYLIDTLQRGGAELLLSRTVANLDPQKYTPIVCHLYPPNDFESFFKEKNITVYNLNLKNRFNFFRGFQSLRKILIREKVDLIHTHLYDANILGRLVAKSIGLKKIVTTLHNPDYSFEDNGKVSFKLRKFLDKMTGKWNKAFIAVSGAVKSDYEKHLGFMNIKVIYNGIDPKDFQRFELLDPAQMKVALGFQPQQFIFSNIARHHSQKAQEYLIQAFERIQKKYPHAALLIVGEGPKKHFLQQLAADLNLLNKNIFFLKKQDSIGEILKASDVFVLPSLYEGFGISAIEAMYLKVPVIASNSGGLREIIEDKKDGLLVPPADTVQLAHAMEQLMTEQNLRSYLGAGGHKKVMTHFLIEHSAKGLDEVYQNLP